MKQKDQVIRWNQYGKIWNVGSGNFDLASREKPLPLKIPAKLAMTNGDREAHFLVFFSKFKNYIVLCMFHTWFPSFRILYSCISTFSKVFLCKSVEFIFSFFCRVIWLQKKLLDKENRIKSLRFSYPEHHGRWQ